MTQPSPTLTPVVGAPSTITRRAQLTGIITYDGPYQGGSVGAGLGSVPIAWDATLGGGAGGWKNTNTNAALTLPLARADVTGASAPTGQLVIDLTWVDESGVRQSDQLRMRPIAGADGVLDLTRDQTPTAVVATPDLVTAVQQAAQIPARLAEVDAAVEAVNAEWADTKSDIAQSEANANAAAAEALGMAGITAAYISDTTADPGTAPDGTYGAKLTAGNLWQRVKRVAGAWQASGSPLMTLLGLQRRGGLNLADYGLVEGGDIYGPLTAAMVDVADGGVIHVPPGNYTQSAEVEFPTTKTVHIRGTVWRNTRITASAAMRAQLYASAVGAPFGSGAENLMLNGAGLAQYNIRQERGKQWLWSRLFLTNATVANMDLGRDFAPGVSGAEAYEAQIAHVYAGNTITTPTWNFNLRDTATDNQLSNCVGQNAAQSYFRMMGGNNYGSQLHGYGYPDTAQAQYGFELGQAQHVDGAYVDGVTVAGIIFRANRSQVTRAAFNYPFPATAGVPPVHFADSTTFNYIQGQIIGFTGTVPVMNLGAAGQNDVLLNPYGVYGSLRVSGPTGTAKNLQLLTGTSPRWIIQSDSGAESGSNAGSTFKLQRRADNGGFLEDTLIINRASGFIGVGGQYAATERLDVLGNIKASGNFIGANVTLTNGVTGDYANLATSVTSGRFNLTGAAGTSRDIQLQTAGVARWSLRLDSDAETGSAVGSNLRFVRRDDTGAFVEDMIFLKRSNGFMGLGGQTGPTERLDVLGNIKASGTLKGTAATIATSDTTQFSKAIVSIQHLNAGTGQQRVDVFVQHNGATTGGNSQYVHRHFRASGTKDVLSYDMSSEVLTIGAQVTLTDTLRLKTYTKATLPNAGTAGVDAIAAISDGTAGKGRQVYSNGTAWLYLRDDSAV